MGAFWRRVLGVERRSEFNKRTINALLVRLTALEQQLAQVRGNI